MKLVPYEVTKIPGRNTYSITKNLAILDEFANGDFDCVEVKDFAQKTASGCANSLRASIKRFGRCGITVVERNDRIFLIRTI